MALSPSAQAARAKKSPREATQPAVQSVTPDATAKSPPEPKAPTRKPLACVYLGDILPGKPCGSTIRNCKLHGETTSQYVKCSGAKHHCATCNDDPAKKTQPATIVPPKA